MRITFIATLQGYWGGSEVLWVKIAELAIQQGHDIQVVVYSQTKGLHPDLQYLKSRTSFVEMPNSLVPAGYIYKVFNAVKAKIFPYSLNEIYNFKPDCIVINQVNNYSAPFHPAINNLLLRFTNPYFLISQFNDEHKCLTYEDIVKARNIFNKAKHIFFVSKRNKEVSERQLAQTINNYSIIDNPINLTDTTYINYPIDNEKINFASVARLDVNYKGQDVLFQILSGAYWENKNWHLNLYGEGSDEQYLKELRQYYKIDKKISFKGHISDIRKVWKENHVLLMPSIAEGKPLAIEEAMICGRVVIASDVAGNSELIDHGINGYIASSFFPEPFNDTLKKAWEDRNYWEIMGKRAHEKMISFLDPDPGANTLNKILKYFF